jgi:phosphatidylserine/phosphatidylglycerophosphate/cardiolipin synthase-like enzyme
MPFTARSRDEIRDALLAAKRRGVDVRGVTEGDQYRDIASQRSIVKDLQKAGIPVAVDTNSGLMHLKVLVTDRGYLSGSYNWTASATNQNDEVLEIGTDDAVRDAYKAILEELFARYPSADGD